MCSIHTLVYGQNWQWAQKIGNLKSDKVTSIKTDDSGYIYIGGYFSNQIQIGTNLVNLNYTGSQYSKEAFIAKLDSNGFCYWARSGGNYFDDRVLGMDVDAQGNSIIVGTYWSNNFAMGSLNINNTGFGSGDQCFIVKHNPQGTIQWATFVASTTYGDDQGLDVATDKAGNSYVVGFMTGANLTCGGGALTAVNPNVGGAHNHCYWITKIDANGNFKWVKTFGNLPWDPDAFKYVERDIAVCVDETDGVYITGGFDGVNKQFGTQLFNSYGGHDIFAMKYDTAGNFKWATHGGSNKDDWSNGICSDKNGNIYITGEHRDSLLMDTILVKNYNKRDAFVIKLDANTGKPKWGKRAGSNLGGERGNDIWADSQCNIYVTGDINEGAKFGDNITLPVSGKMEEAFVARMTADGKWLWVITGGGTDSNDRGNAIAKGKGEQLYVAGYFRTPATYGSSNLISSGSSDGFFARIQDTLYNKGMPFDLIIPADTALCIGDTAVMNIPKFEYLHISPSSGFITDADTSVIKFSSEKNTTYTIWGASKGECSRTDTVKFTILMSQPPFYWTAPVHTTFCKEDSLIIAIPFHQFVSVSPNTGYYFNADTTFAIFQPTVTTAYTLIGFTVGPCGTVDTLKFIFNKAPDPLAEFAINPTPALIQNPVFNLLNQTTGATNFEWKVNQNLFSTTINPTYTAPDTGKYCFTLRAISPVGCIDTVMHCASVIRPERVFFPNAFSPNNDQTNDIFKPLLLNIDFSAIQSYKLVIVNRFGEVVFESDNPSFGWDGSKKGNGKICDVGVYYYMCSFVTPQGVRYDKKGDVTLIQ